MVRGNIRGRPNIRGIRSNFKKTFVPRHPFDQTLAEIVFPKVTTAVPDDSALTNVREFFLLYLLGQQFCHLFENTGGYK